MHKVSKLTHLTLELGCEDYSFLDQVFVDTEYVFDLILIYSIKTLGLDVFFGEPDNVTSSVSSGFL